VEFLGIFVAWNAAMLGVHRAVTLKAGSRQPSAFNPLWIPYLPELLNSRSCMLPGWPHSMTGRWRAVNDLSLHPNVEQLWGATMDLDLATGSLEDFIERCPGLCSPSADPNSTPWHMSKVMISEDGELGGEMTQTMHAHVNKRIKKSNDLYLRVCFSWTLICNNLSKSRKYFCPTV
jgi:hypothetical protein